MPNKPDERVLLVDDDPNVLRAYQRRLRRRFDVETALCSEEGVTAVNFLGPFAVIVSDMTMPRENGADFLARMLELSPDSVRIMLTGNADQATAAAAVNRGRVFRFLNKPCDADELEAAIDEGIEEHRRVANRNTGDAVVDTLMRVLAAMDPAAHEHAERLAGLAADVAAAAGCEEADRLAAAARCSQLTAIFGNQRPGTHQSVGPNQSSQRDEGEGAAHHRSWGDAVARLLGDSEQLAPVARLLRLLAADPNGADDCQDEGDPSEARDTRLLAAILRFGALRRHEALSPTDAIERLLAEPGLDAEAIDAVRQAVAADDARRLVAVGVDRLVEGMRLVDDVATTDGIVLVASGQEVTDTLRGRLAQYAVQHTLREPVRALAPAGDDWAGDGWHSEAVAEEASGLAVAAGPA